MEIPIFQVDAFTSQRFAGNPAAVCPLETWLEDDLLQCIAAENNLPETAFFVPEEGVHRLRWFTPTTEVDLCGHATLATAFVLYTQLGYAETEIRFETRSGTLTVARKEERLEMNFPSRPAERCDPHPALLRALGVQAECILAARDYLVVLDSEAAVRGVSPDFSLLSTVDRTAAMVTARGDGCDFVSRFFAPAMGISEDPVTGSAFCTLAPYWAGELGKESFFARQLSARGGEVYCAVHGDRVSIAGEAALYLTGTIRV